MNTLIIENISFKYGKKPIYENFSLTLHDGINVFLGPNGCGKTTLFKILATIYEKSRGKITLNQLSYDKPYEIKHCISYLPQNFDVYPTLKVKEFLLLMAKLKTDVKTDYAAEVKRVGEITEINGFLNTQMKKLSEGMKKRVGIAQALLGNPSMLIVDEPTAGLDPEQRNNFNLMLSKIAKDKILVISTHIIEDIHSFYDNITIINDGKISFNGNYNSLIHSVDGKAFSAYSTIEKMPEIRKAYTVIEEKIDSDKVRYKLIGEADAADFLQIEKYTPELKDIWIYYRRKSGANREYE